MLPRTNAKLGNWSLVVFGIVAGVALLSTRLAAQKASVTEKDAFQIVQQRCFQCHGEALQMSGLDLRTQAGMLKGGTNGPAIVPGNAAASPLYQRITGQVQPAMPMAPVPKLTAEEIAAVKTWIEAGAPVADESKSSSAGGVAGGNSLLVYGSYQERKITDADREWWSFKKPVRAAVPRVSDARWSKNPIDGFVKAKLEEKDLTPAPAADRNTLIRRAYLDLVGLLPSPAEVDAIVRAGMNSITITPTPGAIGIM
jgi:mono/diheme cytochrome c family protein